MNEIKKSSAEWSLILYGKYHLPSFILDPDGWDRKNFQDSWNEPITIEEYQKRLSFSTVSDFRRLSVVDRYIKQSRKQLWYKLSPELVDGEHWSPIQTAEEVIDAVQIWCSEMGNAEGESFTVEVISMTQEEFDALPEI